MTLNCHFFNIYSCFHVIDFWTCASGLDGVFYLTLPQAGAYDCGFLVGSNVPLGPTVACHSNLTL